jgi:hypothetical protein
MKKKVLQNYENRERRDMPFSPERGKPGSRSVIKYKRGSQEMTLISAVSVKKHNGPLSGTSHSTK